tara:strand:+ start:344 stop:1012 length:669 start_codon:yes stop_codon:yes gene_type:complete
MIIKFSFLNVSKKLKYLINKPASDQNNLKIIFLLHGYGSNEEDLYSLKEFFPSNYITISLRAPISLGFNSYAWYSINFENNIDRWIDTHEAISAKNTIINDILLHLKDLAFTNERVSLLGFSQGAILSWSIGIEYPNLIKNVLPLSGFYHSEITETNLNHKFRLNSFSTHGINDRVIPIDWARRGMQSLSKYNIDIEFKEYESGHEINNENLRDVIEWLVKN